MSKELQLLDPTEKPLAVLKLLVGMAELLLTKILITYSQYPKEQTFKIIIS